LGNPVALMLTPGQAHDLACAEPLIDNADPDALLGDKAYDADPFIATPYGQKIETAEGRAVWRRVLRVCRGACGRTTASPANL